MIVAGTGHRPNKLGGYSPQVFQRLVVLASGTLEQYRPKSVISGMALGWDQALAAAAIRVGIPFIAAVPFAGQESCWPTSSQQQYRKLLKSAASVQIVCSGGYSPLSMQRRNEWMVDNATHVLALFNGSAGGTANCVRYARKAGKPIRNLWDQWSTT